MRADVSWYLGYGDRLRYAQRGGLTDERRALREQLRLGAASRLFAVLECELAKGPGARGGRTRRGRCLGSGRRFYKSCTVQGVAALFERHGWSCQTPARQAVERDERVVAGWEKETWPQAEGPWRRSTPGSSSRTKPDSR
ncbi:winged helix-turn-helix domain-containing protein [Streptomyces chartreusis]|uniref:helix-turn-helix domain-containing protein n=1 Tax=Streptomyces chartreusis TaxID=1969 RepID=UPI00380EF70C